MVKNGHFGRLYINSYPATQPSATTSHDPAASSPEKPSSTQAPGLEKSRGDANHDSGPVDFFGLHDGSKGHPENTYTPLNVNETSITQAGFTGTRRRPRETRKSSPTSPTSDNPQ